MMKIGVLFSLLSQREMDTAKIKRYLHLMHEYGRWAMLDVMVVAVLKTSQHRLLFVPDVG